MSALSTTRKFREYLSETGTFRKIIFVVVLKKGLTLTLQAASVEPTKYSNSLLSGFELDPNNIISVDCLINLRSSYYFFPSSLPDVVVVCLG